MTTIHVNAKGKDDYYFKAIWDGTIVAKHPAMPHDRFYFTWRLPDEGMTLSEYNKRKCNNNGGHNG